MRHHTPFRTFVCVLCSEPPKGRLSSTSYLRSLPRITAILSPGLGLGAAQHGDLVPQHQQFGVLGRRRAAEQDKPVAEPNEDQIEQEERHG